VRERTDVHYAPEERGMMMIAWYYLPIALGFGVCLGLLVAGLARSASLSEDASAQMHPTCQGLPTSPREAPAAMIAGVATERD
jgi:hypothetical protein